MVARMQNFLENLAVQSFCFRGFMDNEKVASLLKETGASAIELWARHGQFDDPQKFTEEILPIYQKAGVKILSLGVQRFDNNAEAEEPWFECAQAAGADMMSVDFRPQTTPESFRTAEILAEKYDMRLGIHNHGGKHWLGSGQILEWVLSETSERIGLTFDTAWALHSHEDPTALAERFAQRIYGVHLKDFVFEPSGRHQDVIIGEGNLDLPAFFQVLRDARFRGMAAIEYEADVNDPVPALARCVSKARQAWEHTA
jgi:sugar phosphate isomerase/epimerase